MGFIEFITSLMADKTDNSAEAKMVIEVLEKDSSLQQRLQRAGLLSETEVPVEKEMYAHLMPCSWDIWRSLNAEQQTDILSTSFNRFLERNKSKVFFAHLKGIEYKGAFYPNELTAAYTDPQISKILVENEFIAFRDYVRQYENVGFNVTADYATGLNVKMSAVE